MAELTHPYWAFTEAGYTVEIVSPKGGDLMADGFSDPEDASGYSAADILSLGFKKSERHAALLKGTKSIAEVDLAAFDAIFLAGGQSPMVTMIDDVALHAFVARAYEAGKVVAIVCHGTCVLLKTRLSNGDLLVKGKTWTGFANAEEAFADAWWGSGSNPSGSKTRRGRSTTRTLSSTRCSSPSRCATETSSPDNSNSRAPPRPT